MTVSSPSSCTSDALKKHAHGQKVSTRGMCATAVDTEQEQLDVLLSELSRIEGQQTKLRDAVTHSQAIVVHPRREVCTLMLQKWCNRHLLTCSGSAFLTM